MKYILFLTLPLLLCAKTTFITQEEYAAQLYKNPRGIGCQHCHGDNGEGKLVAKYIHKNEEKSFRGPVINTLDYATFYNALNKRLDSMPRYFLTSKEISALYFYLNKEELQKAKNAKKEKEEKEMKEAKKEVKTTTQTQEIKQEVNVTTQTQEIKQEVNITTQTQEIEEEIKQEVNITTQTQEETEIIDVREMFKATEVKNAK